jgi:methylmalonyl-CoA/ethylmalonyl-CoA epimerase
MIKKIDHIGIIVRDVEAGKKLFGAGLGLTHLRDETSREFNCVISFFQCGDVLVELVQPIGPGPGYDFLNEHGEGIHHICYEVDDISAALETAKEKFTTDYSAPKEGAGGSKVIFLNAESICNVETEFVEHV